MRESNVAPLSGLLFALLMVATFLVDPNTDFMPPQSDVVAYFQEGSFRIMAGAYLGLLAAVALVWFSGSVYASTRRGDDDGGGGRLAILAFGGGILAAGLLAVGEMATVAAAERVWTIGTIDPGAAASLFDISGIAIGNGAPLGLGVMIGAFSLAGIRVPAARSRWVHWVGLLIAVGLISPYSWAVIAVALIWVPAVGIWMYRVEAAPIGAVLTANE